MSDKREVTPSPPSQINELVQFKIVEKEYEVKVPKFVEVTVEKPVYVNREYQVPVLKEKEYEKPILIEKQLNEEILSYVKGAIDKAIRETLAELTFHFEIPVPKVFKVEKRSG